jgi:RNA polymerase sigma-70 factor (ECF subfamily)
MMSNQNSRQHFATTHWSIVMQADAPRTRDARDALIQLCLRFWYPIYAYVRQCGHSPAVANDITHSFLQHLFRHFREQGTAQAQGKFRQYLLARLHDFLSSDWRSAVAEPVAELADPPQDLEARNQRDNSAARSPEQAYQQSFALELLARALARLREEARETGHLDMFEALEPFLAQDPSGAETTDLAGRLKTRPLAVVVAMKRLRQRFRELIDMELADTVASADELLAEQQALYAVLREGR